MITCPSCGRTNINLYSPSGYCGFCIDRIDVMKQTMTRRFYKTHSAIQRPQILGLYSEAVASASSCIEAGTHEEYYIVEVVAIVKRQKPVVNPIVVEEVLRG